MPKGKRLLSWREILLFFQYVKDKLGVVCSFGNAKKLIKFVDMAEIMVVFH